MSTQPPPTAHKMGLAMWVLAWGVLLVMLSLFFKDWLEERDNPNQAPNSNTSAMGATEVTLLPNRQHHYVVRGEINGAAVTLLLDTGATDVVVPLKLATALGLKKGQKHYATTANGTINVYRTYLKTLSIGDIHLEEVPASINPGMTDDVILLGMSALKQIEFTQRGETLILRQYRSDKN